MGLWDVVIAWDTETTGLGSDAEVIELGVVTYYKGQKIKEWSSFFCPRWAKPSDPNVAKALEINQINFDMLIGHAPTFTKMAEQVAAEMSEAIWVAHNSSFDERMLSYEFKRLGLPVPKPQLAICTKNLDYILSPGQPGYKLGQVSERWGVVPGGAHRAVWDAQACGDVFAKMVETGRLPDEMEKVGSMMKTAEQQWKSRPKGTW